MQNTDKRIKKIICTVIAHLLSVCVLMSAALPVGAQKLSDKYGFVNTQATITYNERPSYFSVLSDWQEKGFTDANGTSEIQLDINGFSSFEGGAVTPSSENGVSGILWDENTKSITWEITAEKSGFYNIQITYCIPEGSGIHAYRAVTVDGEYSFREAENIPLRRIYKPATENKYDTDNDEVFIPNTEVRELNTVLLSDSDGIYNQPLKWYLSEGQHKITFHFVDQTVFLSEIVIKSPVTVLSYKDYRKENGKSSKLSDDCVTVFQAEDAKHFVKTTDATVARASDGDPATMPQSVSSIRFNAVGGAKWSAGGQSATFKFEIPEDGYYKLALRVKQNFNNGLSSYRKISIDGKTPFDEVGDYEFRYDRDWYTEVISDDEFNPYMLYLTKGSHTLTMEVTQQRRMPQVFEDINEASNAISKLYRDILLITSSEPDTNYDYELDESIADLSDRFESIIEKIEDGIAIVDKVSKESSSVLNSIKVTLKTLCELRDDPDSIPLRLDDIVNAMTDLSSASASLKSQPLLIDEIGFYPEEYEVKNRKSNFFEKMWATIYNFIVSFGKDYNSIGGVTAVDGKKREIEVWISRAKEWANVIQELIQSDYVANGDVNVKLNILPSGSTAGTVNPVLLAITSGDAPDVILGSNANTTIEYAIRDIVVDLSQMEDFGQVSQRFPEKSFTALKYMGGTYGLPETVNFQVLMYRKDIINSLGLAIPNTWDEVFYQTLPVLYQNNMQMAAPTFALLLYQNGGRYYTDDGLDIELDSAVSFAAFEQNASLYKDLGFPIVADFYNRFRTGEMPLGIVGFDIYLKVLTAAPELANKIGLAQVPGTLKENGDINRTHPGLLLTTDMILSSTKDKDAAWDFLKWWTSADVQTEFGKRVEGNIGVAARWNSSNMEAFAELPWNREHLAVILESFETATDIPSVLGGTITDTLVNNAINSCLYDDENPREALEYAVENIRSEFKRKQKLYNIAQ